ncbi:hypothetical protein [uncultured Desulfobacter sp.]|uniref:hypothetical protein n=1 Tax=uncultured Desulfobacter sp. TaxID=240139 RepID=UPI002AAB9420|nr:hypothetical protein [uncultured Desulfobacter sp.]
MPADILFKQSFDELENTMGIKIVYFDLAKGVGAIMEEIQTSGIDAFGGCVNFRKPRFAKLFTIDIPVISPKLDNGNPGI